MVSRFRLELDVLIDGESAPQVVDAARQWYESDARATTIDEGGIRQTLSAEEFIGGVEDALMELTERNPLLTNLDVDIENVACRLVPATSEFDDEGATGTSDVHNCEPETIEEEYDPNECETGLYLCRWPNSDFSIVKAEDRSEAVFLLDEWAGADPAWLVPLENCMIDFRLKDHGRIELAEFGEETAVFLWQKCFPFLDEVLSSEDVLNHLSGDPDPVAANKIRAAVEHERKRLWNPGSKRTEAGTEAAQELQVLLGKTGPATDCIAEQLGSKEEK